MPKPTTKTSPSKKTSTKKVSTKKTTVKKTVPAKKVTLKSADKSLNDRVARLEEKLSALITVLHHNFAKDLVKGPKDLAKKIGKHGLLE